MSAAILSALLAGGAAHGQAPAHEPDGGASPRCEYGAWSAPERVPGLAPGEFVRDPSLAVSPEETYVLGNDISLLDSTLIPSPPLIVLTLNGKRIAAPPLPPQRRRAGGGISRMDLGHERRPSPGIPGEGR